MPNPRELAERAERAALLPDGDDERFSGYGVMGLPFSSGHILGLRCFPASSVGPGYTSVWHRDPEGSWTFYSNVAPLRGCDRYFGSAINGVEQCDVLINWTGPRSFSVTVGGGTLQWEVNLASTPATRAMNAVGGLVPDPLWRRAPVLSMMEAAAGRLLRAGRVSLQGRTPNGQWFVANPRLIWSIPKSAAVVRGEDLGGVGPAPEQARLGDFWIPQRGMFAVGAAFFQSFDATLHRAISSQMEQPGSEHQHISQKGELMSDTMIPALEESSVVNLRNELRGELVQYGDESYDEVRTVYNAMIDKQPALIVRCSDVADVISAVNFARYNELLPAVRGGGHNGAGLGMCDGGLVIDLSPMKGIRVDPAARIVRVEGGATWGEVDHATHAFGLATPSGIISTTGVGGLTLGGLGHLTRKCGLTIDNLISADVALADGSFVTASEEENEDLFWAIRGGGGNFGVVTSFVFRLHQISTIIGGPTLWPLEQAPEVMRWYRDFIVEAPEDLNGFFAFLTVPPGPPFPEHLHMKKMCGIVWCYTGTEEEADEVFSPVLDVGPPALHGIHPMPYPALQSAFDGLYTPGLQWYWKADFINEISDEAIEEHMKYAEAPTMHSTMHLYPINGAAHRVGKNDTPWSYRESNWGMVIAGVDPDPSNKERITEWAQDYWKAIHPHSAGGAYVNMMMDEGQDRIRDSYRDNYDRLAEVKKEYDPDNLFRVSQNIKPGE